MTIKEYIEYRDRINLARSDDDLRKIAKQYRDVAQGNDLEDLNKILDTKQKTLNSIGEGPGRALMAGLKYSK